MCDIPVFHDDQHGTAVVVLAALINSLKIVKKKKEYIKIVLVGAGAAGTAITNMLLSFGVKNIIVCDVNGAIYKGKEGLSPEHIKLSVTTNLNCEKGTLVDVIKGADVFIGVARGNLVTKDMVKSMAQDAICFAMSNPVPEIMPDEAKEAGAAIVGTGRSDYNNQINNVLAFPGIFRGALDARAKTINIEMKLAAANAIANLVSDDELNTEFIIPNAFDERVGRAVAEAVAKSAKETQANRI